MPEPVTVWMVHLGGGTPSAEIKGTLRLGERGLEFVEAKTGVDVLFAYPSIRKAKRIRGSPVLLMDWVKDGADRRTAFYFSQPPPLKPGARSPTIDPRGPLGPFTRPTPSKRQVARMNLGYLRSMSARSREALQEWAKEISQRASGAA